MTPQDATGYVWLAWLISWFAAAVWSDRTVNRPSLRRQLWYRATTACGALLMFGVFGIRRYDIRFWELDGGVGWLLVAIAVGGVLFMWWARLHLGRLWSASVTRKADHLHRHRSIRRCPASDLYRPAARDCGDRVRPRERGDARGRGNARDRHLHQGENRRGVHAGSARRRDLRHVRAARPDAGSVHPRAASTMRQRAR